MAFENATLTVENKEVIFIKPSKPTPTTILSLSSIDNAPENFLEQSLHVYRSANHNSPNATKLDPANVIKDGLSKALIYYYPLAGKLVRHADRKLRINCTSEEIPFIEAICNCDLSSLHYLDGNDVEMAKHFGVDDFPSQNEFGNLYPFVFKVTKFLRGGFTFAVRFYHVVYDGTGLSQFLRAEPMNTMPVPCDMYERASMFDILPPSNLDPSTSGGVRVYTTLPSATMPKFKEEMKALRTLLDNAYGLAPS
ncbi:10-deacetylbaccatin III 10-O-acetyltransferase [Spatholobus suberectus]|nr:10-deacetylbaccatin III 10-O-acetyltransferase [Spatholobus suberectus]